MCGIAGLVSFGGRHQWQAAHIQPMIDAIAHRGPDGEGIWIAPDAQIALGHRRLSIIDLSDEAAQPMALLDQSLVVGFNGEIYNHLALRAVLEAEGHEFKTSHSDTEVLLHGFRQWGMQGLLERLEGDYGFAIWDEEEGALYLARDRIGVKPLYFAPTDGGLIFGSEIKAILSAHVAPQRDIDPIAMRHYLTFLTTPAPLTMFKGIFKLPAGHMMCIDRAGGMQAKPYWEARPGLSGVSAPHLMPQEEIVAETRRRLREAIEKRMISDVPMGVFLSGGIDSSTNVALMSEFSSHPVNSFSVGFKDFKHLNELHYARQVADHFGTKHHEVLIDADDMRRYLADMIVSQEEPIADWVCVPLYFVSKLARDTGMHVVQVGEGADEQFSGYASYMAYLKIYQKYLGIVKAMPPALRHGLYHLVARLFALRPALHPQLEVLGRALQDRGLFWSGAHAFGDMMRRQILSPSGPTNADYRDVIAMGLMDESLIGDDSFAYVSAQDRALLKNHPDADVLTQMVYKEFKLRLPELLLMRVDKITMSVSLEARVPFLDHHLVEYTMDFALGQKVPGGVAKHLLKQAVRGIIPDAIIDRPKMGFGAPMSDWLKGEFGVQAEIEMLKSSMVKRGFFDMDAIRHMFARHRRGAADHSLHLWTLYNLHVWYDHWIDPDRGMV